MTTSYDGTRFAIAGGRYTTYDPLLVYKGFVNIFSKMDDTWDDETPTYDEYEGTSSNGGVGYTAVLSNDGKKLAFNGHSPTSGGKTILYYVEENDDGSWTDPIQFDTRGSRYGTVKAVFSTDASRLVVGTGDRGIHVFEYDADGGEGGSFVWNKIFNTEDNISVGGKDGMMAVTDDAKRIVLYGRNLQFVAFEEQADGTLIDGSKTDSYFLDKSAECALSGNGEILVNATISSSDGNYDLNAYIGEPPPKH